MRPIIRNRRNHCCVRVTLFILIYCQKFDKANFFNYFLSVDNYAAMKGNLIKFNPIQFLEGTVMKINLAIICYRWFIPFLLNNIVLNGFRYWY